VLASGLLVGCLGCDGYVYLGLRIEDAAGESRGAVQITQVDPGTPAATAGLEPNDVIVSFVIVGSSQRGVTSVAKLQQELAEVAVGQSVTVKVYRSRTSQILQADIVLTADPTNVPTSLGINLRDSASPSGVVIVSVTAGSVADTAGLAVGDVITKFGSTVISNVGQFRRALAGASEGSTVTVSFRRGTATTDDTTAVTIRFDVVSRMPLLGITAQDLSSQLAERLGYPALGGVRVEAALIDGPAFQAGLMPLDVIFRYGDTKITKASELVEAVRARGSSGTVTVDFSRGGDILTTIVQLQGPQPAGTYTLNVGLALIETAGGLLVVEITSGSAGASAALQLDDIITAVDGQAVSTVQEFYRQLAAALARRPQVDGVVLSTLRNGVPVSRFLRIRESTDQSSQAKRVNWDL